MAYNKQQWKDEIPDLTKPIKDALGKQKTDPQTGRPLYELVQEGTRITSARLNYIEDGIANAHAYAGNNTKQVPHLGTTTNNANAYSITTTETIEDNQKFTVTFNAASTGAPSLSVSTIGEVKPIIKAGGAAASIKAGVYTLFHNGANFQLLGEGGGEYGTATAADVVAPKTIGTENGLVVGKIVSKAGTTDVLNLANDPASNAVYARIPLGAYITKANAIADAPEIKIPYATVRSADANLDPANRLQGKPVFGQDGAIPSYADGTVMNNYTALPGRLYVGLPKGAYLNSSGFGANLASVQVADPNFVPAYHLQGFSIFGQDGAIPIIDGDYADQRRATARSYGPHSGDGLPYMYFGISPNSFHRGLNWIRYHDPAIVASNLRAGVAAFNGELIGTLQPRLVASGTTSMPTGDNSLLTISGIGFKPSAVFWTYSLRYESLGGYNVNWSGTMAEGLNYSGAYNTNNYAWSGYCVPADAYNGIVNSNGFTIRFALYQPNVQISWWALG